MLDVVIQDVIIYSVKASEADGLLVQEAKKELVAQVVGDRASSDDVVRGRDHRIWVGRKVVSFDVLLCIADTKYFSGLNLPIMLKILLIIM